MQRIIDEESRRTLEEFGFGHVPFETLGKRLKAHGFNPDDARIQSDVQLAAREILRRCPGPDEAENARLTDLGREAIANGEVGCVVLNGGMATRFGGVVKGVVKAYGGRSFLDLKLSQIDVASKGRAPILLMNSFSTAEDTARHLAEIGFADRARCFSQFVSVRLTPAGDVFLAADGKPSLHAPGHGDFSYAIAQSGELARFIDGGGKWLTLSNVDNLGAGLDPLIIGMHIDGKNPISVELVESHKGDVGGFPATVSGHVSIVEAFRLPLWFEVSNISVFNTNTFVFDAASLANHPLLDWFAVKKQVDGRDAIQFERLVGQLTEHFDVTWLLVPREGAASRFVPIKVPSDLETSAADLRAVLAAQGVLSE